MKIHSPQTGKKGLNGHTILFLSLPKHDGHYTSTPWQIAAQLAKQNKVIFVDHPFTFVDLLTGFFKPGIKKRFKAFFGSKSFTKNDVHVILTPFVWPVNFLPKGKLYDFFSYLNHRILASRVNGYLRKHSIDSVIYVNSFNFYFPALHRYLKTSVVLDVYHCIDPMVKAFTVKHGQYLQQEAAQEADLIISTAPSLQKSFMDRGFQKSYLVPNAANFELFNKAVTDKTIYKKLDGIEGKVMGYLGNIERRTDFELLRRVLDQLPEWQLVLAGPVERQYVPVEIFEHKRIHFIGPVPHEEAPSVVRRFDVALIPFKCDEVSQGIYPLKLFEYMAAGKPVVSTNFNPDVLSELNEVVHVAETEEQFADFVLLAYATDSQEKMEKRIQIAAQNTWEQRAQLFSSYLIKELDLNHRLPYVA
ncbi:glycosyltransferase [Chryseosolibacter indicus]|uniref:Glycosyltransferase n=1 Tax=Chryseosolibacter indicus TaxID=2782351 RepID=A0ABS5VKZ1_9BACT|nr:glycosyltransferase [Chryseosolibacter indicus]MBT1701678.1 glycosyltransferase [Chryseosolibacter indicus]